MELGEKMKYLRKEEGITQCYLANRLYVSVQTINKWENNKCLPDAINLLHIADFYNISLDDLMKNEVPLSNNDKRIKQSKSIFNFLDILKFIFKKRV